MISADAYFRRAAALEQGFRGLAGRHWSELGRIARRDAGEIAPDATRAVLTRVRASHRGIAARQGLKDLVAGSADQDFLDEICGIAGLERLELLYPVTAARLDGLRALKRLRFLRIDSPRNVTDFSPLLALPSLTTLIIENARHMADVEWLADAHHLEVIGVEGGMTGSFAIGGLAPLARLRDLRALLATGVRLREKDLFPLAECQRLEFLACGRFAPRPEFEMLRALKPGLVCTWFHPEAWGGTGT